MKKERFSVVGQSLPKIDAWAKVAGETKYADDLILPRMAHGKLLRSPHPHALSSLPRAMRGRIRSSAYLVSPATLAQASILGSDCPMTEKRSFFMMRSPLF